MLKDLYEEVAIATGVYYEVVERGWVFRIRRNGRSYEKRLADGQQRG